MGYCRPTQTTMMIEVKLNNIVRTITTSKKFSHVTFLHKKLNFLKLKDVCKSEPAKFMHKLFHNKLPNVFKTKLIKLINIHSHETRKSKPIKLLFVSSKQNCLSTQIKPPRSQAME